MSHVDLKFVDPPPGRFVVLEGYDGAGKTTLINELGSRLPSRSIRVVGRKAEPSLVEIATVLERAATRPDPRSEMLLRIAVEVERTEVVSDALVGHDIVVCDRGMMSLVSWFDYLGVEREPFEPLIAGLSDYHRNAVTVVCVADFETCWARSSLRTEKSRKDRLGKTTNRRYFEMYESNVRLLASRESDVVFVNTVENDIADATDLVLEALVSRGF